jgi:hypothetical protein
MRDKMDLSLAQNESFEFDEFQLHQLHEEIGMEIDGEGAQMAANQQNQISPSHMRHWNGAIGYSRDEHINGFNEDQGINTISSKGNTCNENTIFHRNHLVASTDHPRFRDFGSNYGRSTEIEPPSFYFDWKSRAPPTVPVSEATNPFDFPDSGSDYSLEEMDVETSAISFYSGEDHNPDDFHKESASLATSITSLSTDFNSQNSVVSSLTTDAAYNNQQIRTDTITVMNEEYGSCNPQMPPLTFEKGRWYIRGEPTDLDILCGRGGNVNHHAGNVTYLKEVSKYKAAYRHAAKRRKFQISEEILLEIKNYGGRFLIPDKNRYFISPDDKSRRKISQALREGSKKDDKEDRQKARMQKRNLRVQKTLSRPKPLPDIREHGFV